MSDDSPSPSRRQVYALLLVLLATAVSLAPVLRGTFAYDDEYVVRAVRANGLENPMVAHLQPLAKYFQTEYWTGANEFQSDRLYRPITILSFAMTHAALPGDGSLQSEALPHRLLNLLLHLANTALVYLLALRWTRPGSPAAWIATALFGLGAIHSEAVAAMVGRADLLAFGFGLAGWLSLTAAMRSEVSMARRWGLSCLSAVALFGAFCAKESGLGWWPFYVCAAWVAGHRSLLPLAVGVVPVALWWLLRSSALAGLPDPQPMLFAVNPLGEVSIGRRVFAGLAIQGFALLKTLVPVNLASDHGAVVFPFAVADGEGTGEATLYLLLLAGFVGLAWPCRRRARPEHRLVILSLLAFIGLGAMTSNILVPIGTTWAERLAYLPSLAVPLLALAIMQRPVGRWALVLVLVLVAGYLGFNAVQAFDRCLAWRDSLTLFTTDAERRPRSLPLGIQAAIQEKLRGDRTAWRRHLDRLMQVEPRWVGSYIELGGQLMADSVDDAPPEPAARTAHIAAECQKAEAILRRATRPDAIQTPAQELMLQYNLGMAIHQQGRYAEAMRWFDRILATRPEDTEFRHRILTLSFSTTPAAFARILDAGLRLQPDAPLLVMHRGIDAARAGRWSQARQDLESALPRIPISKTDDHLQRAWLNRAEARRQTGDEALALNLLEHIATSEAFAPRFQQAAKRRLQ